MSLAILFLVIIKNSYGQDDLPKESKIQKNSIKSITISKSEFETGKEVKEVSVIAKYNDKGQLVEYSEWDTGNKFVKHEKYEYNQDGEKVKEIQYNSSGAVSKINEYKYKGKLLLERVSYLPNGKIKSRKVYTYDFYE